MPFNRDEPSPAPPSAENNPADTTGRPESFAFRSSRRNGRLLVVGFDGEDLRMAVVIREGTEGIAIEAATRMTATGELGPAIEAALADLPKTSIPGFVVVATTQAESSLLELPVSASQWTDSETMVDILATKLQRQPSAPEAASTDRWRYAWIPLQTPVSESDTKIYPWLVSSVRETVHRSWRDALASARLELECILPLRGASAGLLGVGASAAVIEAARRSLCVAVVQPGGLESLRIKEVSPSTITEQDLWDLLGPVDVREVWYSGPTEGLATAEEFAGALGCALKKNQPRVLPGVDVKDWADVAGAARSAWGISGAPVAVPIDGSDTQHSFWRRMRHWWGR